MGNRALVLVVAVRLDRDFFSQGEVRRGVLAIGLAFLGAVDAAESDAFSMVVVQYLDGVAVENRDDGAKKFRSTGNGGPGGQEGATKEAPYGVISIHVRQASADRVTSFSWDLDTPSGEHRVCRRT